MAKKTLENLITAAVSNVAPEAPKVVPPLYPKFNVTEARESLLSKIEVEEVRRNLIDRWAAEAKTSTPERKKGRKAVGLLSDYTRCTMIVKNTQFARLKQMAQEDGRTVKEIVEYVIELGLTVIDKNKK